MNLPTDSRPASGAETTVTVTPSVYDNSAETGVVQGAEHEDAADDLTDGQQTNAGGLNRTGGAGVSTLSDNVTGNNSMGTSTIGGGFGVGSTNSNSTLP